jgi:hypothetical protein
MGPYMPLSSCCLHVAQRVAPSDPIALRTLTILRQEVYEIASQSL